MTEVQDFFQTFIVPDLGERVSNQEMLLAIALSFVLTCLIAAVYKHTYRGALYSQDYVHALVIFGTVVTVVMMIVRGDIATAFGIFAAFSIIRFRRNLPHSRDIAFVFFAMVVGMVVGAREYWLAVIAAFLVSAITLIIWKFDLFAPSRPSHFLRVRIANDLAFEEAFEPCFSRFLEDYQLLTVESAQAGLMTEARYSVRLKAEVSAEKFLNALREINGNNRIVLSTAGAEVAMNQFAA
jgi:hypothetical protein